MRGLILIDYKPWDGSENVAGKLVAAKVSREEMLNRLGREHFYRGEYEQAVRYFKEVVENYPDSEVAPFSLDHLFCCYREMGKEEVIYPYLEAIAESNPGTRLARVALELGIKWFLDRGDFHGAIARSEEIMEMFPDDDRNKFLLFNIGVMYELAGETERAKDVFEEFLERYPACPGNLKENPPGLLPGLARIKLGLDPWGNQPKAATGPEFFLRCRPNPFNAQVVVGFSLPEAGFVRLGVYDVLGRKLRALVEGKMGSGLHRVVWDGRDEGGREVSSGVYVLRLEVGGKVFTRKVVMVR